MSASSHSKSQADLQALRDRDISAPPLLQDYLKAGVDVVEHGAAVIMRGTEDLCNLLNEFTEDFSRTIKEGSQKLANSTMHAALESDVEMFGFAIILDNGYKNAAIAMCEAKGWAYKVRGTNTVVRPQIPRECQKFMPTSKSSSFAARLQALRERNVSLLSLPKASVDLAEHAVVADGRLAESSSSSFAEKLQALRDREVSYFALPKASFKASIDLGERLVVTGGCLAEAGYDLVNGLAKSTEDFTTSVQYSAQKLSTYTMHSAMESDVEMMGFAIVLDNAAKEEAIAICKQNGWSYKVEGTDTVVKVAKPQPSSK